MPQTSPFRSRRLLTLLGLAFSLTLLPADLSAQQVKSYTQVEGLAVKAAASYKRAGELQSKAPPGKISLGARKRYGEAVELWKAAHDLYPDAGLAYNLGNGLAKLRRYEQARERYKECADHPGVPGSLKSRALNKIESSLKEQADMEVRRAAWLAKRGKTGALATSVDHSTILVVVGASSPVKSLSEAELRALYAGDSSSVDGVRVIAYNRRPADEIRRTFDRAVLGMSRPEALSYWKDQQIRGGAKPPNEMGRSNLLLTVVGTVKNTVAYVYAGEQSAGVRVLARIQGGKVKAP